MEAPEYIAARVQRALAEDERTHELGIRVVVRGDQIFLHGEVPGGERRALIGDVAGEAAPGLTIRNELTVTEVEGPLQEEKL